MVGVAVGVVTSIDLPVRMGRAAAAKVASDGPLTAGVPVETSMAVALTALCVDPGVTLLGGPFLAAPHADTIMARATRVMARAVRHFGDSAHPPHSGFQTIRSHPYRLLSTRLPAKTTSHDFTVIIAHQPTQPEGRAWDSGPLTLSAPDHWLPPGASSQLGNEAWLVT